MKKPLSRQRMIASLGGLFMAGLLILYMAPGVKTPEQLFNKRLDHLSNEESVLLSLTVEVADTVIQAGQGILNEAPEEEKAPLHRLQKARDALLQTVASADIKQRSLSPAENDALAQLKSALAHFVPQEDSDETKSDTP